MNFEKMILEYAEKEVNDGIDKASKRVEKSLAHISRMEIPFMIAMMEKTTEQLRSKDPLSGKMADTIKLLANTKVIIRKEEER